MIVKMVGLAVEIQTTRLYRAKKEPIMETLRYLCNQLETTPTVPFAIKVATVRRLGFIALADVRLGTRVNPDQTSVHLRVNQVHVRPVLEIFVQPAVPV